MNFKIKNIFLFIILLNIAKASFAQDESKQFIHKGILRATLTISPGMMLKENISTVSLNGNLEYYVNDNISLRGDGYYFLKSNNVLEYNHSAFAGASYHFKTKNHLDPYVGLQSGIAIAKRKDLSNFVFESFATPPNYVSIHPKQEVSPLIAPLVGFNFYFQRWFHLFIEARYIYGKHLSTDGAPSVSLSELRFSFGLGFNLGLMNRRPTENPSH